MARSSLEDYMQDFSFWLYDVAPIDPLALPVFTPLLGFSAISAPELTVDVYEVEEANWLYRKKILKKGDVSSVTLTRGARWFDADFYRWILAGLTGDTGGTNPVGLSSPGRPASPALSLGGVTPRRDVLLIQFAAHSPFPPAAAAVAAAAGLTATTLAAGASIAGLVSAGAAATAVLAGGHLGPFEFAPRIPAKAWMLYGCVPTRYKVSSDFDAKSSEISLQELEMAVEYFDEISLSAA